MHFFTTFVDCKLHRFLNKAKLHFSVINLCAFVRIYRHPIYTQWHVTCDTPKCLFWLFINFLFNEKFSIKIVSTNMQSVSVFWGNLQFLIENKNWNLLKTLPYKVYVLDFPWNIGRIIKNIYMLILNKSF